MHTMKIISKLLLMESAAMMLQMLDFVKDKITSPKEKATYKADAVECIKIPL